MQNNQNIINIITQIALSLYKQADILMQLIGRDLYFGEELKEPSITVLEETKQENRKYNPGENNMPPKYADGSLRKRKNGIYEYRFKHFNRQISVYGKEPQICYNKRTDIIAGKEKNKPEKTLSKTTKYSDWLDIWYENYKKPNNGKDSLNAIQYYFNRDIKPTFGNVPIKNISDIQIQKFINKFKKTPNAQNKIFDIINGSFEKLCDLRILTHNICRSVELKPYKPKKHYPVIQPQDQNRILENIKLCKYINLFKFCCCTGLRIGEALNIEVTNIDFNNNILNIIKEETETKGGCRKIPFLPALFDGFTLTHKMLFADITYQSAKQYLDRLCKKLNIPFTLHSTRHTFISCCYHIDIKPKQIQIWAGHQSITMTMDTYTHIIESQQSFVLTYLRRLKEKLGI